MNETLSNIRSGTLENLFKQTLSYWDGKLSHKQLSQSVQDIYEKSSEITYNKYLLLKFYPNLLPVNDKLTQFQKLLENPAIRFLNMKVDSLKNEANMYLLQSDPNSQMRMEQPRRYDYVLVTAEDDDLDPKDVPVVEKILKIATHFMSRDYQSDDHDRIITPFEVKGSYGIWMSSFGVKFDDSKLK